MHFSIPESEEFQDKTGNSFNLYTISINGAKHCSVRFSQLNNLNEQLVSKYGKDNIATFPSKKLFSLNSWEKEERRIELELYLQKISENIDILHSEIINSFFSNAQKETEKEIETETDVTVYLMNFEKIVLTTSSYIHTEALLAKCLEKINLKMDFIHYFGLYLVKKDEKDTIQVVRELQEFENPCISFKEANKLEKHKILLRKSTFDLKLEENLLNDKKALNLLYIQAVSEFEWDWVKSTKEAKIQLEKLQENNSKREFLDLIKTQKHYGFIHLKSCVSNYPEENTMAQISIGSNFMKYLYLDKKTNKEREMDLKVTRIKCWKIHSLNNKSATNKSNLEFSFEYLIRKSTFQWITLKCDQSILLSMCLTSMVDEILIKNEGRSFEKDGRRKAKQLPFLTRDKSIINTVEKSTLNSTPVINQNQEENDLFDTIISNDDL